MRETRAEIEMTVKVSREKLRKKRVFGREDGSRNKTCQYQRRTISAMEASNANRLEGCHHLQLELVKRLVVYLQSSQ
jgi:hypothetical protein